MKSALREIRGAWSLLSVGARRTLIVYGFSLAFLSLLDALALVLVAQLFVIDSRVLDADFSSLAIVVILFVVRTLLSTVTSFWTVNVLAREEVRIGADNLRTLMNSHLSAPVSEVDYFNAVDRGPNNVAQGLVMYAVTMFAELASGAVILLTLLFLDFVTAVVATAYFLSVAYAQNYWLSKASAKAGEIVTERTTAVYERLADGFRLRKVLQVMPSATYESTTTEARHSLADARGKVAFLGMLPRYTMEMVLSVGLVVVAGMSYLVAGESAVVKSVAIFGVAGFRLLPTINRVQGLVLMMFSAVPTARLSNIPMFPVRVRSQTDTPHEMDIMIDMENVSFRYPNSSSDSLHGVNLKFKRGLQYAIIGSSGAGKTTLIDLILDLLHPTTGTIRRESRITMGYVPQDTYIARTSFSENVALEWDAARCETDDVRRAVSESSLRDLADRWSLESSVHLNDLVMSGGQRQRIGFARAVYRDPDLLVLDEVTSALDAETERILVDFIRSLRGERTVIVVAHRLTTVQFADQVVYVDNGEIVGVGPFDELRTRIPQLQRQIELGNLDLG